MKKIWKRFLAYLIDMMVVLVIVQSLSGIPFLNSQLDSYKKYYNQYVELTKEYTEFRSTLAKNFDDKKLTEKEYQNLIEKYPNYQQLLESSYQNKTLKEESYNKLLKTIDDQYQEDYKIVYYKIEKNSLSYFIIYLIVVVAYFVGFNLITNGQTLGKKLCRLKIVSSNGKNTVLWWSYLIRTLILYQPLYYIVKLIGIFTLKQDLYYTVTSYAYDIQYYLELVVFIMVVIRHDARGLHDILAKTKVVIVDARGEEIEDEDTNFFRKKLSPEVTSAFPFSKKKKK